MPKSKIKFYQESSKKISNNGDVDIKWLIVNDSDFSLEKVKASSQFMSHLFGEIEPHTKEEFRFLLKIPSFDAIKEDFGEDATVSNPFVVPEVNLNFTIKTDTFDISSNSLEIPF